MTTSEARNPLILLDENGEDAEQSPKRAVNFLGRSVRIVGHQQSPDPHDDPHARVRRGELGKIVQNYYYNRFLKDPLDRMSHNSANADDRAVLTSIIARSGRRGAVNEDKTTVPDASVMTAHIKRVANFFGADAAGIAPTLPEYVYEGGTRTEDEHLVSAGNAETAADIARRYPYAICFLVAWDDEMVRAHRHPIGDTTYHFGQQDAAIIQNNLAGYIRELGYDVRQGGANPMPLMLAAGLGELGRNGLIISEKFGPRVHPQVILTNLPLVPGKPIDLGVSDFCKVCRKCAVACPTNSISFDKEKKLVNGVEKYAINWKTCYSLRPHMLNKWYSCLTCVAACPYTKPDVWWRTLTLRSLRTTPIALRPVVVRALVWLDDAFWGKLPRKRVQWLGFDTGVKVEDATCTIAGCSCHENEKPAAEGQYPPFKENARRFASKN